MDWPQIISFTLIAIVLEVSPGANPDWVLCKIECERSAVYEVG